MHVPPHPSNGCLLIKCDLNLFCNSSLQDHDKYWGKHMHCIVMYVYPATSICAYMQSCKYSCTWLPLYAAVPGYIYMYMYTRSCKHGCTWLPLYAAVPGYIYMYMYTRSCKYRCTWLPLYVHTVMQVQLYLHGYLYNYLHTYN